MDPRRSAVRHSLSMPTRRRPKGPGGGQFAPNARPEQPISDVPLTVNAPGCTLTKDELLARYANGERDFPGVNCTGADRRGVNFGGVNFGGANLRFVNFTEAYLGRVNFTGADLTGADLRRVNITVAYLTGVPFAA